MKKATKTLLPLLSAFLLLLSACGGGSAKNVPVSALCAAVNGVLPSGDSMAELDSIFTQFTEKKSDELGEHSIQVSMGTTIDEYGIFKAGNLSTRELQALIRGYLAQYLEKRSAMLEQYNADEKTKVTDAETRVVGDYVMYCIMSPTDRAAAFKAFEDALK